MSEITIELSPHPLLRVAGFTAAFAAELGATPTPAGMRSQLALDAHAPLNRDGRITRFNQPGRRRVQCGVDA